MGITHGSTTVSGAPPARSGGRTKRGLLWTIQILLALVFLAHGLLFLFPPAAVAEQMNAVLPRWFQLFLGVAEILAAAGLTLPAVTGRERWLMAWAAGGIMIVMISATIFHLARREISSAVTTLVLLGLATVVTTVRRREYPRK
jgi:hypothetical protein